MTPRPPDNYPWAEKIKWLRTQMGLTQVEFGKLFDLGEKRGGITVSDWERGKAKPHHFVQPKLYELIQRQEKKEREG